MIKKGTLCEIICPGVLGKPPRGAMCEVVRPANFILGGFVETSDHHYHHFCNDACLKPIIDPPDEALMHDLESVERGGLRELIETWDEETEKAAR